MTKTYYTGFRTESEYNDLVDIDNNTIYADVPHTYYDAADNIEDKSAALGEFIGYDRNGWMVFGGGIGRYWKGDNDHSWFTIIKIKWNDNGDNCYWKSLTANSTFNVVDANFWSNGIVYLRLGQKDGEQLFNSYAGSDNNYCFAGNIDGYFPHGDPALIVNDDNENDPEAIKISNGESFQLWITADIPQPNNNYTAYPKIGITIPAYEGNFVHIYSDGAWHRYRPWIYNNGWQHAKPFVYNNGWKQCR